MNYKLLFLLLIFNQNIFCYKISDFIILAGKKSEKANMVSLGLLLKPDQKITGFLEGAIENNFGSVDAFTKEVDKLRATQGGGAANANCVSKEDLSAALNGAKLPEIKNRTDAKTLLVRFFTKSGTNNFGYQLLKEIGGDDTQIEAVTKAIQAINVVD